MRVGSLFSGIGGIDLGLERAGMRVIWQCEAKPYRRAVLHKHWPDVPCYSDIRDIGADVPAPDLICGGFPCQPVSLVGRRKGKEDARWLWPEFARVVGLLRPNYVLVENVRGLASKGLREVLADLTRLGYDAEWEVVSAASVGAPHLRERIFIVAYPDSERRREITRGVHADEGQPSRRAAQDYHVVDGNGASNRAEQVSPSLADTNGSGWQDTERGAGSSGEDGRKIFGTGHARSWEYEWEPEPNVGRTSHGVPARMDRLSALGDAVVPRVAEVIGRWILEAAR